MALPVWSDPVNEIFRTRGCSIRALPTSLPKPVMTFTTPGGKPASANSPANSSMEAEVNSDGLMTTVQPAANAGAIFQAVSINGEFHRSEEHTSELQSLMRISYAVFCLKKKKETQKTHKGI